MITNMKKADTENPKMKRNDKPISKSKVGRIIAEENISSGVLVKWANSKASLYLFFSPVGQ